MPREQKEVGVGFIGLEPEPLTPRGRRIVLTTVVLALLGLAIWVAAIVWMLHNPGQGSLPVEVSPWFR